jgi:hypothetical protein
MGVWRRALWAGLLGALMLLSACGEAVAPQTPAATPTLSAAEWDATKIAYLEAPQHELETQVASGTPFAPTLIPVPTAPPVWTPTLGISGECAQGNHQFDYGGCWAGIINNEYLFVDTGALFDDPAHGVVRVFTTTMDLNTLGSMYDYRTPSTSGVLHPVQVSWPVMTLEVIDSTPPVRFGFDLLTRQWVSPPPVPSAIVSPEPSPVPSVTP